MKFRIKLIVLPSCNPREEEEFRPSARYHPEPVNIHGKHLVYKWEAIMPSGALKWTIEGKLPYFAAFGEIEKHLGASSELCPIHGSRMFRPVQAISSQKLESMAADIAQKIGLELPPVNFYAIVSCYCKELSLPTRLILPVACHICEWCMPSELYLSTNESRNLARVCVMSILIVTIWILWNINGYGMWESCLSNPKCSSSGFADKEMESQSRLGVTEATDKDSSSDNLQPFGTELDSLDSRLSVMELLWILEANYNELYIHAYFSDLQSYLLYCKNVVFSGLQPAYEDPEEEKFLKELWRFYQSNKGAGSCGMNNRSRIICDGTRDDQGTCSTSESSGTSNHGQDSERDS
ncbi:hypothetical protein CDL12_23251 [Handroanthus impetiginosus]|uniref:Uncharacterized protein n=1 Tax=Handroanthus impetiginosus TaxID=429701 RepID=A0A2G9GG76_9LAMI|nr:hypothetical protein CDL12_23251 [Handroanthus impetiginosus]